MKAQVVIQLNDEGQIQVSAPRDRVLTYGLLEAAKDVIRTAAAREELQRVVPVGVIPNLGNGGR